MFEEDAPSSSDEAVANKASADVCDKSQLNAQKLVGFGFVFRTFESMFCELTAKLVSVN